MAALMPLDRDCTRCGSPLFAGLWHVRMAARFGRRLNDWPKVCARCVIDALVNEPNDHTDEE